MIGELPSGVSRAGVAVGPEHPTTPKGTKVTNKTTAVKDRNKGDTMCILSLDSG